MIAFYATVDQHVALKMVPTAAMSGALAHKQAQLSTMHSYDFPDKGRAIKGLLSVALPNILRC